MPGRVKRRYQEDEGVEGALSRERPRALIVDNEKVIRWVLAQRLGELGFAVVEASEAKPVLERVQDVDIAILDEGLPHEEGAHLAATLKSRHPACAVILMTTQRSEDLERSVREAGIDAIVEKPFELAEIADLVRKVLRAT